VYASPPEKGSEGASRTLAADSTVGHTPPGARASDSRPATPRPSRIANWSTVPAGVVTKRKSTRKIITPRYNS